MSGEWDWHDEVEEERDRNRERFWIEEREVREYRLRVAAGELTQPGDNDECAKTDRRPN